tara:strand:- start:201 stop:488 length:288 start_codon:yes stop_codon:yes gene_type:complete
MNTEWNDRVARQVRRNLSDMYDKNVTQIEFATWVGYSRSAVQNWESGKAIPEPAMRRDYFRLLEDPGHIEEIMMWEGANAKSQHKISKSEKGRAD